MNNLDSFADSIVGFLAKILTANVCNELSTYWMVASWRSYYDVIKSSLLLSKGYEKEHTHIMSVTFKLYNIESVHMLMLLIEHTF